MKVIYEQSISSFLSQYKDILIENEPVNQIMLFNCLNSQDTSKNKVYGGVYDDNQLCMIFFNAYPRNLLLYEIKSHVNQEVMHKFILDFMEKGIVINGINTNQRLLNYFLHSTQQFTKCEYVERLKMDIMVLHKLNPYMHVNGKIRKASIKDLKEILQWTLEFYNDSLHEVITVEEIYDKIISRIQAGQIYVFEVNGTLVSTASVTRILLKGVAVSMVFTSRENRGKGYGYAVVYGLCKAYLDKGYQYCTLFVDQTNPISNKVYKKIGFKIVKDSIDYRMKEV